MADEPSPPAAEDSPAAEDAPAEAPAEAAETPAEAPPADAPAEATAEAPPEAPAEHPGEGEALPSEGEAVAHEEKPISSGANLVDKRLSTTSHVRLLEPGQPSLHEGVRRSQDLERRSRQLSTISSVGGERASGQRASLDDGILRRRSDRPSKARSAVGSTISIRKTTSGFGEFFGGTKAPKFMNTYKLDSDNPFVPEKVEKILSDVLTEALDNLTYDSDKCPKQAKWACSAIRAKVKEQEYDRYKLICLVTIGEKRYHDMCSVVRFLWDIDRDKYAIAVQENMYVYAAALCFGVYYE